MQGSKEGVCSLKSSDQEGLIEKVIFEKREERGSGGKCRDQGVKSCLPFLKYNKATNMSEVRSEVSRGRCINLLDLVMTLSFILSEIRSHSKALNQGLLCSHMGSK